MEDAVFHPVFTFPSNVEMFRALQECPDCPLIALPVTLSSNEAVKTFEEGLQWEQF